MFCKTSHINRFLRGIAFKVFNKIENNLNTNFEQNGEKVFLNNLFHYLSSKQNKKVVFDVGANIGEYAHLIEKKSLEFNIEIEVHLFEPTQKCFSILNQKFNNKNFILNNFGVSNKSTVTKIFYDKEGSGLASLYQRNLESYHVELNQSEEIQLKRLDEYIKEKSVNHIDFIKIDIEGHELNAFEGMGEYLNSDFIDFIQFEYGGANLDSHTSLMDIYKVLNERGFKIAKIMPKGLEIREYKPYMDNFQYSNYVAISKNIVGKL